MSRGRIALYVGGLVLAVVLAIGVYLLIPGTGPDPLEFDDATTTLQPGASVVATDGRWILVRPSQAGYRVLEDRIGGLANVEAVGRTYDVSGGFEVDGTTVSDVEVVVDVATIASDSGLRDGRFRDDIMTTSQFPTATFAVPTLELPSVPEVGATVEVPVTGQLTLRGVTRDVQTTLQVRRTAEGVEVLGSVPVLFVDYGIQTPSPPGLSVRDNGVVEFLLVATPEPPG